MKILNVKIDNVSNKEALKKVIEFLQDGQHIITTPNPEMILDAQNDGDLKNILNQADLALPDGFGLILASKFLRQPLKERISGVDFMQDICALAEEMRKSVFLVGGKNGVAAKAAASLVKKYPQLKIADAESEGLEWQIKNNKWYIEPDRNHELIEHINVSGPDIIFVAFGHNKQERWIAENLTKIPSVKIAMGVGGAFDFIAGMVSRAPVWMRKIGLEWFWRLLKQPWRIKRIFNAIIVFPIQVIFNNKV
jgi:N-acetylglucosaminyldiphosphoundecaprenol N-acetyl-beta-D-mannosaminyltransferase